MPSTNTFGFEAEFSTPANLIVPALFEMGHLGDIDLHNYTCDCEFCSVSVYTGDGNVSYNSPDIWPLRAKHDSSCGGEIISKVFTDINDAVPYFTDLEAAAIQTDTEPGLEAGFHVHVGRNHLSKAARGKLVVAMTLWENTLFDVAAGRWPHNRGWNMSLTSLMQYCFMDELEMAGMHEIILVPKNLHKLATDIRNTTTGNLVFRRIADAHMEVDRHSSMAFSPRWPTMEFRLWNSTRAAWRMELWCRLSLLFADIDFIDTLLDEWTPDLSMSHFFATVCGSNADDRLKELLERQVRYVEKLRTDGITQFNMPSFAL